MNPGLVCEEGIDSLKLCLCMASLRCALSMALCLLPACMAVDSSGLSGLVIIEVKLSANVDTI